MFFPSSANYYNTNPFSHLPSSSSSSYHLPQHLLTHETNDNVVLNHHFHDLVSASSLLPAAPNPQNETLLNMAFLNKDGNRGVLGFGGRPPPGHGFPVKKALKKDRHSKICTAQGVRERRVRLSIEIARDFFDLQDMLGFDKASKTVEWLLRKSRNAIKELAKMKQCGNVGGGRAGGQKSLSLDSGDDDRYETVAKNRVLELEGVVSKEKKSKKLQKSTAIPLKESRAKARARARERTREKMNSCRDLEWKTCPDLSPYGHSNMASSSFKLVAHQVEQVQPSETSIVIRRMLKPSAILGYQQSCNSSDSHGFPNLSQNWDINAAMAHSN
ncbi:hypothetical protein HRI_004453800 [Hibiscus trionum]|uniref:Uncharacterized protein n=1 Tax=Hibiscus trionum TaxID=183268 RepID=A0A9W7J4K8_HIBTR|nr:hypothetical protein HRI_004453800 [Hibiscus trionum]